MQGKNLRKKGIDVPHAVKKTVKNQEVYVNYLDDDGALNEGITEDDATYPAGKTVAATIFRPESNEAYCKSCGEPLGFLDDPIEDESEKVSYKLMNGSWVYTAKKDKKATAIYYIEVTETVKDGLKAVLHKTNLSTNETTSESASAIAVDTSVVGNDVRALYLGQLDGTNYLWISQDSTGAWTLKRGTNSTYKEAANKFVDLTNKDEDTLIFIENHNHLYGTAKTTDEEKKANIANDSYFEVMKHLGMNYITSSEHYLYCGTCGMKYLGADHYTEDGTCLVCGGNESYVAVTISETEDQNVVDALTAVKTASQAATSAASLSDNTKTVTALTGLVASLQNAKSALEYVGDTTSAAYKALIGFLSTDSASTAATSIAKALSEAKTTAAKAGTSYEGLLNNGTTSVAKVLGATDDAEYTDGGAEDSVAKILKSAEKLKEDPTEVDTFYVKSGTVLPLEFGSYTSFRGTGYSFADDTGWTPSDRGVHLTSEGWEVTGTCKLSFSLSEKNALKK